jgi:hypothetical protein
MDTYKDGTGPAVSSGVGFSQDGLRIAQAAGAILCPVSRAPPSRACHAEDGLLTSLGLRVL